MSASTTAFILQQLDTTWPDARCELLAGNSWHLLVAVILSARTSDERVNQTMAQFTEHCGDVDVVAGLHPSALEPVLKTVPFFRQKARFIVESARMIMQHFNGSVPRTEKELATLPGVGVKTAAVVAGNAFNVPTVAVDVHVQRVVERFAWSEVLTPQYGDIVCAVEDRVAADRRVRFCHQLIRLGREHCRPKKPWCSRCPVQKGCAQAGVENAR